MRRTVVLLVLLLFVSPVVAQEVAAAKARKRKPAEEAPASSAKKPKKQKAPVSKNTSLTDVGTCTSRFTASLALLRSFLVPTTYLHGFSLLLGSFHRLGHQRED